MRRIAVSFLFLTFAATIALAHYPATLKIEAAAKKQPAVTFNHAKHGDTLVKSCDTCHHTQKGLTKAQTDKVDVKKCNECHLDPKDPKMPSMREMAMNKNPMHIRCIACHKEQKKGPTICKDCHVKG